MTDKIKDIISISSLSVSILSFFITIFLSWWLPYKFNSLKNKYKKLKRLISKYLKKEYVCLSENNAIISNKIVHKNTLLFKSGLMFSFLFYEHKLFIKLFFHDKENFELLILNSKILPEEHVNKYNEDVKIMDKAIESLKIYAKEFKAK